MVLSDDDGGFIIYKPDAINKDLEEQSVESGIVNTDNSGLTNEAKKDNITVGKDEIERAKKYPGIFLDNELYLNIKPPPHYPPEAYDRSKYK